MLLYVAVVLWPVLISAFSKKYMIVMNKKYLSKGIYVFIAMLPMFLMIGLRGPHMGADTGTYLKLFSYIAETPLQEVFEYSRMEEGYILFAKFIGVYITQDPNTFQIIYTAIYFIAIYIFMQELDDNWGEFLFFFGTLGLFTFMFTGVRQCLAISVCLISYRFVRRRRLVPFVLLMFLAYNFHHSAILFSVVYLIDRIKLKWYYVIAYIIAIVVSMFNLSIIQEWFNDQLEYEYELEETGSGMIFLVLMLMIVVFSLVMLVQYKALNNKTRPYIVIGFICVFFWILRLQTRVAERPSYYFMFFICAGIAYALNSIKEEKMNLIMRVVVMGVCLLLYIYRMSTNFASFIPYRIF